MKSRLFSDAFEKKRNIIQYGQMADSEFNFQQCSFPSKLHILQIFWVPKHPFILRLSFLLKIPRFLPVLRKMEYIKIVQNGGSKMADASSSFSVINNVIVTSLLLLKVIYTLGNLLMLSNTLLSRHFSFNVYFEGNLNSANKFDNLAS